MMITTLLVSRFYKMGHYNDVSLQKVVELVVVIPTSPRSSKTEFGCSSCCRLCFGVSLTEGRKKPVRDRKKPVRGRKKPVPGTFEWCYLPVRGGGFLSGKSRSGLEKAGLRLEKPV
jgi:hypothetical protein